MAEGRTVFIRNDVLVEIRDALNGDSNDDERDALVEVARELGLHQANDDNNRWYI